MEDFYAEMGIVNVRLFSCKVCGKRCYGDGDYCGSECAYSVIFQPKYNTEISFQ